MPVGLPGAHAGAGIHSPDRGRPLQRRLHDQLAVERVPGNSRSHLRSPVRTGLPPGARRGRTGRDLPAEAGRRRLQGRHSRAPAEACPDEWQEDRAHRRWPGVADRGARSGAARIPMRRLRSGSGCGRHDALADPEVSAARLGDRRRVRLRPRPWRRVCRRPAHRQSQGAAGGRLGRDLRRLRCAARPRPRYSRPHGSGEECPHRHRLARECVLRPRQPDRRARHCAGWRQHGDGLLPHGAPPRRHRRQGRGALRL